MDCQLKDGGKHGPTDIHPLCETYPTGTQPYFLCICVRNKLYQVLLQNLSLFTHQLDLYLVRLDTSVMY